ncbi:GAF domain-containing sensor histidine kinase [Streptomyces griseus]|uniref:GAF domain-containing sensor histidine kinase n=1 Tax=Streptomyces griseus TaxID=1911 RepID=UPI0008404FC9|nr:GAF domain-containing sensor histidine kinase [Streptomyces griseus]
MSEGDTGAEPRTYELPSRPRTPGSRDRVRGLLEAVLSVDRELELSRVLRRTVEEATALVDARYGALAVVGEDHRLSEFITVGARDEQEPPTGTLPARLGPLEDLIRRSGPPRTAELSGHAAAHGTSPGRSRTGSLVGVPVRVRGHLFGTLYLTEKRGAAEFDAEDESVLVTLAGAAGIAIEKSRLYEESRRRGRWLAAGTEVTNSLLSGSPRAEVLALILERARANVSADLGMIAVPVEGSGKLRVALATGDGAERHHGAIVPRHGGYLGSAFTHAGLSESPDIENDPRSAQDARWCGYGPAVAVPVGSGDVARGVLLLTRKKGGSTFSSDEAQPLRAFARQASLAMELAERRREAERTVLLEERDRIARDLHDLAIQRLFATGMTLQSAQRFVTHPQAEQRLRRAVDDLDTTIKIIRSTIFGLRAHDTADAGPQGLRTRFAQTAEASAAPLGFAPALRVEGLADTRVPAATADHAVAVLAEALSNTARHARADRVDVHLSVTPDRLTLTVTDDGVGIPVGAVFSGLHNIEERARAAGGTLEREVPEGGGTRLTWSVPLASEGARPRTAGDPPDAAPGR